MLERNGAVKKGMGCAVGLGLIRSNRLPKCNLGYERSSHDEASRSVLYLIILIRESRYCYNRTTGY